MIQSVSLKLGLLCTLSAFQANSVLAKELHCVSAGYCSYDLSCDRNDLAETLVVKF